jgi:hypothetical protein
MGLKRASSADSLSAIQILNYLIVKVFLFSKNTTPPFIPPVVFQSRGIRDAKVFPL